MNSLHTEDSNQELDEVVRASTNVIYLKIVTAALPITYAISWLPGIGIAGHWALLFLLIALPIVAVVWWLKYRSVGPDDQFLKQAKRFPLIALSIWGLMVVLWLAVPAIYLRKQIQGAEAALQNVPRDYRTVVIVKDLDNLYWAFTADRIVRIDRNRVTIKFGTLLTKSDSSKTPTASQIGDCFLEMRYSHRYNRTGWPFVSCPSAFGVADVASQDGKDVEIQVREVALTRVPEGQS